MRTSETVAPPLSVFRLIFLVLVMPLFAGCASTGTHPAAQSASSGSYEYVIGPGDHLSIFVWRNPDVSVADIPVRPDGRISAPLVEDMVAAGKTPKQLARDIEKVLSQYIKEPLVTVTVTQFVGRFSEQVRVVGEAAKPQALPYKEGMTLLDVMIDVGGLTEFAAGNRATLVRTIDGQEHTYHVRLGDLVKDGDLSANMKVEPGDILIIPESYF